MPANPLLQSLSLTGVDFGAFASGRFRLHRPGAQHHRVPQPSPPLQPPAAPPSPSPPTTPTTTPTGTRSALSAGETTITITGTNGSDTAAYTITITRQAGGI